LPKNTLIFLPIQSPTKIPTNHQSIAAGKKPKTTFSSPFSMLGSSSSLHHHYYYSWKQKSLGFFVPKGAKDTSHRF
ncbi:unnamed protein product, partial [Brassica oleracea]